MEPTSSKKSNAVWIVLVVIIVLVIAAWVIYANPMIQGELGLGPHVATTSPNGMASSSPRGYGGMRNGSFTTGSIETLNGNGFTLTLQDGTTKNVTLSATTTIQDYANASSTPTTVTFDQLSVGQTVLVMGTPNADGSITARVIRTGSFPEPGTGGYRGGAGGYGGMHGGGHYGSTSPQGVNPE
jgi:hypothetical protein